MTESLFTKILLSLFLFLLVIEALSSFIGSKKDRESGLLDLRKKRDDLEKENSKLNQENESLKKQAIQYQNNVSVSIEPYKDKILTLNDLIQNKDKEIDSLHRQIMRFEDGVPDILKPYKEKIIKLEHLVQEKSSQLTTFNQKWESHTQELEKMLKSEMVAFPYLAGMIADYMTYDIEILAQQLDWGSDVKRLHKVASIRQIRADAKARIEEARVAYYQLEYLRQMFPGIDDVLDISCDELKTLQGNGNNLLSEHDATKDYLSKEEWNSLSVSERNQLALDRYVASHQKSKWQIGRDYELYVGYVYSKQGFRVDYFGSYNKLEDLGRDLIVTRGNETAIVQCKYWSQEKLIHEKHIAQLYGTTISYCCENDLPLGSVSSVLVTNIELSDTAKKMADYLNVKYKENFALKDFPRIKCNIGHDEDGNVTHIYHLPMDQQYDIVKIETPGEFFALTVAEAEAAGFRRAYKWHSGS